MTTRDLALALVSAGALLLLGLLVHRFRRGAWSLEDEDIPAASPSQTAVTVLGLALATGGLALFVWSWLGHGVG